VCKAAHEEFFCEVVDEQYIYFASSSILILFLNISSSIRFAIIIVGIS